jgi:hypothetical protein
MQPVSRQRIGKHVPTETDTNTTIELLLETVFSTRSLQRGYKEDNWGERMLHEDDDRKCSVEKKSLIMSLKGLHSKTNWLAVNRQS